MQIDIYNNTAIGLLTFSPYAKFSEDILFYIQSKLYNIQIDIWYDIEQNIVFVRMIGSIVSMMQFRKIILMNWPNALEE